LDESPIFDKERRLAIAFVEGGLEAEKNMRSIIANEEVATRDRHHKAFEDIKMKAKKDHVEKLLRQEQLERLKFEETQKDESKRVEQQRLEQELEAAKQKSMEIEIKTHLDSNFKDSCNNKNEIILQTMGKEDIKFVDMVPRLEGDGKKRGTRDLDNEEKGDEYPQKSLKCQNDEIHFESSISCDETTKSMELDDNQQEWFKTTYKENLQRYDVKNIARSRFLEAMSKQEQKNIQNESVCHVEEPTKINGQTHLQDLVLTNEIAIELYGNNDTTPINTNMIQIDDIGEQIITNTLITIHDQCQSHEEGFSSLLYNNDKVTGWKFQRDLQDGLMLKEVANVEKRDVEVAEINGTNDESNTQSIRPMIWGTCKYRDLWVKATTIDDDTHMDNASPISMDQVMDIELNN
jgi:hypothetical protein